MTAVVRILAYGYPPHESLVGHVSCQSPCGALAMLETATAVRSRRRQNDAHMRMWLRSLRVHSTDSLNCLCSLSLLLSFLNAEGPSVDDYAFQRVESLAHCADPSLASVSHHVHAPLAAVAVAVAVAADEDSKLMSVSLVAVATAVCRRLLLLLLHHDRVHARELRTDTSNNVIRVSTYATSSITRKRLVDVAGSTDTSNNKQQ